MTSERWFPAGTTGLSFERPKMGDLVAFRRAAWRVTHVADATPSEEEVAWIAQYRPEAQHKRAPYALTLRHVHGPTQPRQNEFGDLAIRFSPMHSYSSWEFYAEDRVPLCSCCGHPWPCIQEDARRESEEAGRILEERSTRAYPGLCYACGEVVTSRQSSIVYPEPNIEVPGAPPPRFHYRAKCSNGVWLYESKRQKVLGPITPVPDWWRPVMVGGGPDA